MATIFKKSILILTIAAVLIAGTFSIDKAFAPAPPDPFAVIIGKLDQIIATISGTDSEVSNVEGKLDGTVSSKITEIDANVVTIQTTLDDSSTGLAEIKSEVSDIQDDASVIGFSTPLTGGTFDPLTDTLTEALQDIKEDQDHTLEVRTLAQPIPAALAANTVWYDLFDNAAENDVNVVIQVTRTVDGALVAGLTSSDFGVTGVALDGTGIDVDLSIVQELGVGIYKIVVDWGGGDTNVMEDGIMKIVVADDDFRVGTIAFAVNNSVI